LQHNVLLVNIFYNKINPDHLTASDIKSNCVEFWPK